MGAQDLGTAGGKRLSEAEVVYWLKRGLQRDGLSKRSVRSIVVDADASYLHSPYRRHLEPMGTVWIESWKPDLVCMVESPKGNYVAGFEVKADGDFEKGVVQAGRYRAAVHEAYLCLPRTSSSEAQWIRTSVQRNGVGLLVAAVDSLDLWVPPAGPVPDPALLHGTERYLLGQSTIRAFGLNKPLHYAAATYAQVFTSDLHEALTAEWGLDGSSVRYAVRGAETLGLLTAGQATTRGKAIADILKALGFDLRSARSLTRRRLADQDLGLAALLRAVLIEYPPAGLIIRALLTNSDGTLPADRLAQRAISLDDGMGRAIFGEPSAVGTKWVIRPTTRHNLKSAMYDVGLLDSPLARGSGGGRADPHYAADSDIWTLGKAVVIA